MPVHYAGTGVQVIGDAGNRAAVEGCSRDKRFRGPNREQSHYSSGGIGVPRAIVAAAVPRCRMLMCHSIESYSIWLTENPQMASPERLSLARW